MKSPLEKYLHLLWLCLFAFVRCTSQFDGLEMLVPKKRLLGTKNVLELTSRTNNEVVLLSCMKRIIIFNI